MKENFVWVQVIGVIIRYFLAGLVVYLGKVGVAEEMQDSLIDEITNALVPVIVGAVVLVWSIMQKRYSNAMIRIAKESAAGVPLEAVAAEVDKKLRLATKI